MTREEAIRILKEHKIMFQHDFGWDISTIKALDMAISALSENDVLDKIRAEILVLDDANYDFEGYYKAVTDALHIIDKYKAESEE